jgi:SH3-like domain-containing protein
VTAKQTPLRDRVAAVSNRTGMAYNGEKLVVLQRDRRFLEVRTPRGEVGWIEEKMTAGQDIADQFEALSKESAKDPVVATATTRDEVYLHAAPGLDTARFYRLGESEPLNLLERATVAKAAPGGAVAQAKPAVVETPGKKGTEEHATDAGIDVAPPAPVMEDWWLVRDAKGQSGWIYGRMIDVNAPDTLARYSEGQRIVGAYVLGYADDPDSGVLNNGSTVEKIPEYVTVLAPFKAGLPYDFDQVRVFTWNVKKHRYETAFREKDVAGYLPVKIGTSKDPYGHAEDSGIPLPSFTYRVLAGDQAMPVPDATTGLVRPGKTVAKTYRLVGNITQRVIQPGVPAPVEAHPEPEAEKKGAKHRR